MKNRIKIYLIGLLTFAGMTASADEGMWLPSLISQRIADMQEKDSDSVPRTSTASIRHHSKTRSCFSDEAAPENLYLQKDFF